MLSCPTFLPRSPADAAGIEPGDIVLSINSEPMREARDLALAIFQGAPGDQLHMEIQRGSERMSKSVVILERQNEPGQLEDLANYDAALVRQLGILAVPWTSACSPFYPTCGDLPG